MDKLKKELLENIKNLLSCDESLKKWEELIHKESHDCKCDIICKGGCKCQTKN